MVKRLSSTNQDQATEMTTVVDDQGALHPYTHSITSSTVSSPTWPNPEANQLGTEDTGSIKQGKKVKVEDDDDGDREGDAIALVLDDAREDAIRTFRYLLVFNAMLESFAHGANDTANATAAFTAVYTGHEEGLYACSPGLTPWWIMGVAGLFVMIGIMTAGNLPHKPLLMI